MYLLNMCLAFWTRLIYSTILLLKNRNAYENKIFLIVSNGRLLDKAFYAESKAILDVRLAESQNIRGVCESYGCT